MASSFRFRVFRLLLLFAVMPTLLLTMVGYFLFFDSSPIDTASAPAEENDLSGYLTDLLYRGIEDALDRPDSSAARELDFLGGYNDDSLTVFKADAAPLLPLIERLRQSDAGRPRGIVSLNQKYYQYVLQERYDGWRRVGGIVHDSTFALLVEEARQSSAEQSAEEDLKSQYLIFLGGLLLLVTLVTILAAYLLSRRVSRNLAEPVAALSSASQRIAEGDFKHQIETHAEGEIGRLITSFNRMAGQLDQMTARLSQTERVAAWRQVARRFAHELKNPLQPILISLYRLEKQLENSDAWNEVKEPLRAAREEVQHLTLLAERFSSLAKLPPPKIEPVDLGAMLKSTVELYRDQLALFDFDLRLPESDMTFETDAGYIREATHNLLQNAIDACGDGDTIIITLRSLTDGVSLSVSDTGTGMDTTTLSAARLPYFTTKASGNGLGLAIVERSIAELGGQLTVESEPDVGTTVTIDLPRNRP